MARYYNNTACRLYDTEYCRMLNMVNCEACTVASRSKADMEALIGDLDALKALMPEDGIAELFLTDRCVLCKKAEPEPRSGYALLDLGHHEPERKGTNFLGMKTRLRAGSILPLQLASCDACKKRFAKLEYVVPIWVGVAGVLSIGLLSIRTLYEFLASFGAVVPFFAFGAVMLAAWGIGTLTRRARVKRYAALTHLNVMEIPKLNEIRGRGWFEINAGKRYSRLVFSKKRLRQGVFTGSMKKEASQPKNI